MKKTFLLILLSFYAFIYSGIIDLEPEASLYGTGKEYRFSYPIEMNIFEDELFILDQSSAQIIVFDKVNLQFKRKFSAVDPENRSTAKPIAVSNDYNGNIIVTDYGNSSINVIQPDGMIINVIEQLYPWRLAYFQDFTYMDLFPGFKDAGIYILYDNEIDLQVDMAKYFKKNKFHSVLDMYYSWCVTDFGYVVSFSSRDNIAVFNNNGKLKVKKAESLPLKYKNTLYGKPQPHKDGFLILASSNDHTKSDTTNTKVSYEGMLGFYSEKGKLIAAYNLPSAQWLTDAWIKNENDLYIYDSGHFTIYRFNLD